uniref:Uncharacterized protein n=1 Tax=Chlamydomonas euryale TaxID=1486919 RepID=A0A7R9Z656_9CHLO|mmetsp:Transcript_5297/g.16035  ORF Transcript_5297/g.16035 Transcript_5297/m.16035 type:complete len:267 (+) Transcript_5297:3410-4210(+)
MTMSIAKMRCVVFRSAFCVPMVICFMICLQRHGPKRLVASSRFMFHYAGVLHKVGSFLGSNGSFTCDCDRKRMFEEWMFTLEEPQPLMVDYKFVYKWPTWSGAAINALDWAVNQSVTTSQATSLAYSGQRTQTSHVMENSSGYKARRRLKKSTGQENVQGNGGRHMRGPPNIILMNICAWWKYDQEKEALFLDHIRLIFSYGQRLMDAVKEQPIQNNVGPAVRQLRLVWRSCTVADTLWDALSERLDHMALEHGWEVLDARQVRIQ